MARVLLGITGGIAAYKTPQLVRDLKAAGHEVRVVLTASAKHFVSELSLATVSEHPVRSTLFELDQEAQIGHIELARWPDKILVAPATADLMARCALGRCDDLLSTLLLATRAPIYMAPAMNTQMWAHPATQTNLATLRDRGVHIVDPAPGVLACGETGVGKMAALTSLVQALEDRQDWAGRRIVMTAGPTREALDAVRFISNGSTGKMGFALAAAAAQRGAQVDLVAGPVHLSTPAKVTRHDVQTGDEMYQRCQALLASGHIDWVFKVAAVVDLRGPDAQGHKKTKAQWLASPLKLHVTRDILASLCQEFGKDTRFLGFAAQTVSDKDAEQELVALAQAKMARKGCDAIFVNRVGVARSGFGVETNAGYLLQKQGGTAMAFGEERALPKLELAHRILDALVAGECRPA